MKRILPALLLCLLLLGCGPAAPSREFRLTPTKETENDNLRCYPLDAADCRFFTYGNDNRVYEEWFICIRREAISNIT